MDLTKELPREIEDELVELKDRCWCSDSRIDSKNFVFYKDRLEELHRDGFNVNVFLGVACYLGMRLNGDIIHKGVILRENDGEEVVNKNTRAKKNIAESVDFGQMVYQGNHMGYQVYLGRNRTDKSEVVELWIAPNRSRHLEVRYTRETEDEENKRLFFQRDKILRKAGL